MVDRDDVLRARPVVEAHLRRTPLLPSRTLGARLKCELFQRTGSFKPRGALNKLSSLSEAERTRGVIAISAAIKQSIPTGPRAGRVHGIGLSGMGADGVIRIASLDLRDALNPTAGGGF